MVLQDLGGGGLLIRLGVEFHIHLNRTRQTQSFELLPPSDLCLRVLWGVDLSEVDPKPFRVVGPLTTCLTKHHCPEFRQLLLKRAEDEDLIVADFPETRPLKLDLEARGCLVGEIEHALR